ncbi:hypothetical protein [Devosia sp.]|jgi:hypothetical protein|uniref:hypothetical protein n=1 Tax=Devosia sp. TaxID=1871048 RepID=UPI0037BEF6F1
MTIDFSREALYAHADRIRVHPGFAAAKARHSHVGLDVVDGKPVAAKLTCQISRYATLLMILCHHDLAETGEAPGGVTSSTVLAALGRTPFASRSWAKLMVRVYHRAGMIEYDPPGPDRRSRPFRPTPALMQLGQQAIQIFFEALAHVDALPGDPAELAQRPGVMTGMARALVDIYFKHRFTMIEPSPEIGALLKRDFGYLIFGHLVQTMQTDAAGVTYASVPMGDMSKRFGVSRASVRNILELAERLGFVVPVSKGGHVLVCTPRFVALIDYWMAVDLAWFNHLLTTALARIELGAAADRRLAAI